MSETRVVSLSPAQAQRLNELRRAAMLAEQLYQESVNVIALGVVTVDELPRTAVAHDGATITATVEDA